MTRRLVSAFLVACCVAAGCDGVTTPAEPEPPNILLILTDDQRIETLRFMPNTRRFFVEAGTNFTSAFATTPQCCPSRASILTGLYAHNHKVLTNYDADKLDESTTFTRYLRDAGYTTALAGKYLNRPTGYYNETNAEVDPKNFDRWFTILGGYHDPMVNDNGEVSVVEGAYSTTLFRDRAVEWLGDFEEKDDEPWLLYLAPFAPHAPSEPEEKYADAPVSPLVDNDATRENNLSDKPPFIRADRVGANFSAEVYRSHVRTLFSADDLVGEVTAALERYGEDDNTLAIFMSDNGLLVGENDTYGKGYPYTYATQIPLAIRWPDTFEGGTVDDRIVANIDIAPTILDAAGVDEPEMDGRSLLTDFERERILLEHSGELEFKTLPGWSGLRTGDYLYVEYYGNDDAVVFREFYDLSEDPWLKQNRLGPQGPGDPRAREAARVLARDRSCAGAGCP
ncbi:MAG: sulfatase family protein [Actinomycetota bacterium]